MPIKYFTELLLITLLQRRSANTRLWAKE